MTEKKKKYMFKPRVADTLENNVWGMRHQNGVRLFSLSRVLLIPLVFPLSCIAIPLVLLSLVNFHSFLYFPSPDRLRGRANSGSGRLDPTIEVGYAPDGSP